MTGQQNLADHAIPVYPLTGFFIFLAVVMAALAALIYCRIFAKAGFHWAPGLLVLLPVSSFFLPAYLAFADRPVQWEYRRLRQNAREGRYGTMGGNEL
jgi:hypothetical protein